MFGRLAGLLYLCPQKLKIMEKRDLRNLCIYDLCDDPAILQKVLVIVEPRDVYLEECEQSHPARRALDMVHYADEIGDFGLRASIVEAWREELDSYFNE